MEEVMQVERLELEDIGIRDAVNPIEPVLPMEIPTTLFFSAGKMHGVSTT